jgi:Cu(I)/Ag(I) efflux system membrane protein CusA/SilA
MITRLVDWSLAHRASVIAMTLLLALAGAWSLRGLPLDALPRLGDTQIILETRWSADPALMERQVTAPLVAGLLGIPGVRTVRATSEQDTGFVHVVFDDEVDAERARTRVAETLPTLMPRLPEQAEVLLGPAANALGWVYQYVLEAPPERYSPADMRDIQDTHIRLALSALPGVAEVASLGGAQREIHIEADLQRLQAENVTLAALAAAARGASLEVSGGLVEFGGAEYAVRGRGQARSALDFANAVVSTEQGRVVRVKDVAIVTEGAAPRRGWIDYNGQGDRVMGIVVMQAGADARTVAKAVRKRLDALAASLPPDVRVRAVYDRAELIDRALSTITRLLLEVVVTVAAVVLLFLKHLPSAVVPLLTLPLALLIACLPFRVAGLGADLMSLGGLALAVGVLADAGIVMVEQVHRALAQHPAAETSIARQSVMRDAVVQVATPGFLALLIIAVSFLPVLALEGEEGRLFAPLVMAKSLAVLAGALLGISLDPVLRAGLLPFSPPVPSHTPRPGLMVRLSDSYARLLRRILGQPWPVAVAALALFGLTLPLLQSLEHELLPPLEEGTLLYMPVTPPGLSAVEARRLLQATDRVLAEFPEVVSVLGKAGRANTATDPAPPSMFETLVILKPRNEWREVPRWYSGWAPETLKAALRPLWPDRLSRAALVAEMDAALTIPGLANAWTMPIRGRLEMLDSGQRSALALKISGPDPRQVEALADRAAEVLRDLPGARHVFSERNAAGRFLDVRWRRDALALAGLRMQDAQRALALAVGGEVVSQVLRDGHRHRVRLRLARDARDEPAAIGALSIAGGDASRRWQVQELADLRFVEGPAMIRHENGSPIAYVGVDLGDGDPGAWLAAASARLRDQQIFPAGYEARWSGALAEETEGLTHVSFAALLAGGVMIWLLLLGTRSVGRTGIVLLAVPFSAIGAVWLLWLLGFKLSTAVYVGLLALLGLDAATGIFMLLYLDLAWDDAAARGALGSVEARREAIVVGAARRLRPKLMTVTAMLAGLLPILFSEGTGADLMQRMVAPMIGGIVSSFLLELLLYPPLYQWFRARHPD